MRDKSRISPFLDKLEELWLILPDYRIAQLLQLALYKTGPIDMFYVEDEVFLNGIESRLQEHKDSIR